MQEILKDLYYDDINPNAKQFVRDSEYGKALKIVSDCEEKLNALLSGKELEQEPAAHMEMGGMNMA